MVVFVEPIFQSKVVYQSATTRERIVFYGVNKWILSWYLAIIEPIELNWIFDSFELWANFWKYLNLKCRQHHYFFGLTNFSYEKIMRVAVKTCVGLVLNEGFPLMRMSEEKQLFKIHNKFISLNNEVLPSFNNHST